MAVSLDGVRWRPVVIGYFIILAVLCVLWVPRQIPLETFWQDAGYAPLWRLNEPPHPQVEHGASKPPVVERVPLNELEPASTSVPQTVDPRYRVARVNLTKLILEIVGLTGLSIALLLALPRRNN